SAPAAAGSAPATTPAPAQAPESRAAAPSGDVASHLARIAQCESGGNPRAVSASGQYRGKYQFDQGTWEAYGGTGDPAAAPEAEQDRVAAALYAARGPAPWPVCGYR
ncbi:MAG TPA: transglycosylase family protein, partial [Miltoncostaeaceae bacterium]|nr:transglycosylase family protein [Miltoncostaeaceae bacterium]